VFLILHALIKNKFFINVEVLLPILSEKSKPDCDYGNNEQLHAVKYASTYYITSISSDMNIPFANLKSWLTKLCNEEHNKKERH